MVLDKVADGLRKYGEEKDLDKCVQLLKCLAPTRDPRVAVVLGDWRARERVAGLPPGVNSLFYIAGGDLLRCYYVPVNQSIDDWWKQNEAGLRRRAKQLP
jgi:hypothetical protein